MMINVRLVKIKYYSRIIFGDMAQKFLPSYRKELDYEVVYINMEINLFLISIIYLPKVKHRYNNSVLLIFAKMTILIKRRKISMKKNTKKIVMILFIALLTASYGSMRK